LSGGVADEDARRWPAVTAGRLGVTGRRVLGWAMRDPGGAIGSREGAHSCGGQEGEQGGGLLDGGHGRRGGMVWSSGDGVKGEKERQP
jgi:hypothetical protein